MPHKEPGIVETPARAANPLTNELIVRINKAVDLVREQKLNEAIESYKEAFEFAEQQNLTDLELYPEIFHAIGSLYWQLKDSENAAHYLTYWNELQTPFKGIQKDLREAQIYLALGRYPEAIVIYGNVVEYGNIYERYLAYVGLGDAYAAQGEITKALARFKIGTKGTNTSVGADIFNVDPLDFETQYISFEVINYKIIQMLSDNGMFPEEILQEMIPIYTNLDPQSLYVALNYLREFSKKYPDNERVLHIIREYIQETLFNEIDIRDLNELIEYILVPAQELGVTNAHLKNFMETKLFKLSGAISLNELKTAVKIAHAVGVSPILLRDFIARLDLRGMQKTYLMQKLGKLQQNMGDFDAALDCYDQAIHSAIMYGDTSSAPELIFLVIDAAKSMLTFIGKDEKLTLPSISPGCFLVPDKQYVDGFRVINLYETYYLMRNVFEDAKVHANPELEDNIAKQPHVGHIVLLRQAFQSKDLVQKRKLVDQAADKLQHEIDGHGMQQIAKLYADLGDKKQEDKWRDKALKTMSDYGDLKGLLQLISQYAAVKDSAFVLKIKEQAVAMLKKLRMLKPSEQGHYWIKGRISKLIDVLLEGRNFELLKSFTDFPEHFNKDTRLKYARLLEASNEDGSYENQDYKLWYRRAIEQGSLEAQEWQDQLLEKNFAEDPASLAKLKEIFTSIGGSFVIAVPICVVVKINDQFVANTYEFNDFQKVKDNPEPDVDDWGRFIKTVRDPATRQLLTKEPGYFSENDIANLQWRPLQVLKILVGHLVDPFKKSPPISIMHPRVLQDFVDYISRNNPPKINEFPGFIDPKTGARFRHPRLTPTGELAENDPNRTDLIRLPVFEELMDAYPQIKYLGRASLDKCEEYARNKDKEMALAYALKAFEEATAEKDEQTRKEASETIYTFLRIPDVKLKKSTKSAKAMTNLLEMKIEMEKRVKQTKATVVEKLKDILGDDYSKFEECIIDPVSQELMFDPVTLSSGRTFSGVLIQRHFDKKATDAAAKDTVPVFTDPFTGEKVDPKVQIENQNFAQIIPYILLHATEIKQHGIAKLPMFYDDEGKLFNKAVINASGKSMDGSDPRSAKIKTYPDWTLRALLDLVKVKPKPGNRV